MIGHFPTPYPDELLYSIGARFTSCVEYPNAKSILRELFGATTASAVVDLPNRLSHLSAALPEGTSLTADCLIDKHTLFAFFSIFTPPERVRQLRRTMQGDGKSSVHMRSGIMASRVPLPSCLRFCPLCKEDDAKQFSEAYWHRLHQIPGVEVCQIHNVFLEDSGIGRTSERKHLQFILAKDAIGTIPARYLSASARDHQILLKIAHDAVWILIHPSSGSDLKSLHRRYLELLIEGGFAIYTGSIHVKKLLEEFTGYYSPTLLKLLNCKFTGSDTEKTNWLLQLVRPPKHVQHPLYHLLLIQLLGYTVEEFFQLPEDKNPFREGPWPCLNPAAKHYQQPVIIECQLGSRLRCGKPIGKFNCPCGFAYARTGPDSSLEDRFRISRMISFGQLWEAKLMKLWKDSSLSLSEMGRQLGVNPLTVRRHAARLKLPFSCSGRKSKSLKRTTQLKGNSISAVWENKRRTFHSKWLSMLRQNPNITLKALRDRLPREYAWLLQNDSDWLEGHKPRPQRRYLSTTSVDWKRRDAEYAVKVKAAASRLKDVPGRPVQVTKTAIGRQLGAITLLQQKLHKMPLTAQIMASVIETQEQYAIRRIWLVAFLYCKEHVLPREWQLIARGNVYRLRSAPEVKCTIGAAMKMIKSKVPLWQGIEAAS